MKTEIIIKHMMENLGRWFSLFLPLRVSVLFWFISRQTNMILFIVGVILAVLGVLAMLVFLIRSPYKGRDSIFAKSNRWF